MASKSSRKTAALKAKLRKRAARRFGLIKVRRPGGRMKGRLSKVRGGL